MTIIVIINAIVSIMITTVITIIISTNPIITIITGYRIFYGRLHNISSCKFRNQIVD